ncbi:MipA/OmpV family protein [Enterobacter asburiae]|uniref:MipA/OmpV family protein n=1 Tax=Scandinavium sp. UTDF21-P1B TaxID=3446379 RepID=UPI00347E8689
MKKKFWVLASVIIPSVVCGEPLNLAIDNEWQTSPYNAKRVNYTPFPLLSWDNNLLYIDGQEAGAIVWKQNQQTLKVKALWFYQRSYDHEDGSSAAMRQLNDRRTTMMAGISYDAITSYGMFSAQLARDALGLSDGWFGTFSWTGYLSSGDWALIPSAGVDWEDARQTDYYFGVSKEESRRSGLTQWSPGSSLTPWLQLALDYQFAPQWDTFISARINYLSNDVRQSPMVNQSQTYVIDLGIKYRF